MFLFKFFLRVAVPVALWVAEALLLCMSPPAIKASARVRRLWLVWFTHSRAVGGAAIALRLPYYVVPLPANQNRRRFPWWPCAGAGLCFATGMVMVVALGLVGWCAAGGIL